MKLLHISDLHLGKRVNGFSMLEEQTNILQEILRILEAERPDAVLIAGDVYDKPVPAAEAVQLLDDFLCDLARHKAPVLLISGNHDSPERVAFGGRLMERSGVHVSPVYGGKVKPVVLTDTWGEVRIYLLPFLKPAHVRRWYPDETIESYTDALRVAIAHMEVEAGIRNVLVTHQFVTGAARCESEERSVGGADNVDAAVFDAFDYVALGHLHGPQSVGRESIRYCGSPLKYSFSEARHQKSVTVVELAEKGSVQVRTVPLTPKHEVREIKGSYRELTAKSFYDGTATDDYLHVTLTDETDVPDALGKLRVIYPNLMKLDYDNARTRADHRLPEQAAVEQRSPLDLFAQFYETQNNHPMTEEQTAFVRSLMEEIWEEPGEFREKEGTP